MPFVDDEDALPPEVAALLASPAVEPTSETGPPPSSDPEDLEPQPEPDGQSEDLLDAFDARSREDFKGLMYLGALTADTDLYGHSFEIRTLNSEEVLQVGLFIKDYEGTISQPRAYATAIVAAAVVSVDGKPLPSPFQDEPGDSPLRHRVRVVSKWYPHVIDVLYNEFLALEQRVTDVFEALGKASG